MLLAQLQRSQIRRLLARRAARSEPAHRSLRRHACAAGVWLHTLEQVRLCPINLPTACMHLTGARNMLPISTCLLLAGADAPGGAIDPL